MSVSSRLIASVIMVMKIGCQFTPLRVQFIALMSNLGEGISGFLTFFGTLGHLFSLNLSFHKKSLQLGTSNNGIYVPYKFQLNLTTFMFLEF